MSAATPRYWSNAKNKFHTAKCVTATGAYTLKCLEMFKYSETGFVKLDLQVRRIILGPESDFISFLKHKNGAMGLRFPPTILLAVTIIW